MTSGRILQRQTPVVDGPASINSKRADPKVPSAGLRLNARSETRSRRKIDDHVASRLRKRRLTLGLTQQQVADAIGISSRQISKLEKGLNRVSVSLLYRVAGVFNVPVAYFYDGVQAGPLKRGGTSILAEMMLSFASIRSDRQKEAFSQLVRALAETRHPVGAEPKNK